MAEKETALEKETQSTDGVREQNEPELLEDIDDGTDFASVEALRAKLEEAIQQAEHQKDLAMRSQAELHNVRRRAERDVEHAHKFGMEKIVQELLPVVDSLERALEASGDDNDFVKAMKEGIELTLNMFLKALAKFQIEPVSPEGEPFDPALHQAVSMVEQNEVEPNTVVHVMQKGYTLHGRIVRPAMVVVAKAGERDTPKIDEQA
ncbi:MAG: nucleotide exchange factor GrpE [Pseudomonadales bacterium]|nr:nucleotide exchange factor GrpE [Pseudomonadales bacterium]